MVGERVTFFFQKEKHIFFLTHAALQKVVMRKINSLNFFFQPSLKISLTAQSFVSPPPLHLVLLSLLKRMKPLSIYSEFRQ